MAIITLTTDYGTDDFYVARLKGMIFSQLPTATIIDVTHTVKNFDIQAAAFQVKNIWKSYPQYSLHLIGVGNEITPKNRWIACKHKKQFFILPDNGLISLILEEQPEQVVRLQNSTNLDFSAFLAQVIAIILKDTAIIGLGEPFSAYIERLPIQPAVNNSFIRGHIQHIDKYGNLITNISKKLFTENHIGQNFQIVSRSERFTKIHQTYSDVDAGDKLALFNSLDLLELSINQGNASQLFGLNLRDAIQIEFI